MQVVFALSVALAVLGVTVCMARSKRPDPKMDLLLRLMGNTDDESPGARNGIEQ